MVTGEHELNQHITSRYETNIAERIRKKISEIDAYANDIPGVIIVHDLRDFSVVYMSPRGLKILGVTLQELIEIGPEYATRFFNADESKELVPKITRLLEQNNNEEIVALFQHVRASEKHPWELYCTSIKIMLWDDAGKPLLTMCMAIPVNPENHITNKIQRLLDENDFLRKHYNLFATLTKKEREILKLLVTGYSSVEIARQMGRSATTIDTHRKNIKRKLNVSTQYELAQYARAFDLI